MEHAEQDSQKKIKKLEEAIRCEIHNAVSQMSNLARKEFKKCRILSIFINSWECIFLHWTHSQIIKYLHFHKLFLSTLIDMSFVSRD